MNFFSKKPAAQEEKAPANQQKEDGIDEFLKNTTTEQEAIAKLDIKPEVSAYFLSLEELGSRQIKLETDEEAKDLIQLGVNKRQELFWEKLKNWR